MRFEGAQSQSLMMVLQIAQVSCKGIHGNLSRFQGIMITSQPGVYRVISRAFRFQVVRLLMRLDSISAGTTHCRRAKMQCNQPPKHLRCEVGEAQLLPPQMVAVYSRCGPMKSWGAD